MSADGAFTSRSLAMVPATILEFMMDPSAYFPVVTDPSTILAVVTDESASLVVVTARSAIWQSTRNRSQFRLSHVQVGNLGSGDAVVGELRSRWMSTTSI